MADTHRNGVNFNLFFPDSSIKKYTFAFIQHIIFIFVSSIKKQENSRKKIPTKIIDRMKKIIAKWFYPLLITGLISLLTFSCKKDDADPVIIKIPSIETHEVSNITLNSALCGGSITSDGGAAVSARGICWSTGITPTIADSISSEGSGTGEFNSLISALAPHTTYFVRAYATNSAGTAYGSTMSFTTGDSIITTVTDIDGNVYHTVTIGTQVWMLENLKVTRYRNGDTIANIPDGTLWSGLTYGAYCDYDNDTTNANTYGRIYNWFAVADSRQLAPAGWHVASDAEWNVLINFAGGSSVAGGKLKESGYLHWQSPNTGATNETGFTALPGGARSAGGPFSGKSNYANWWTSTPYSPMHAIPKTMYYNYSKVDGPWVNKENGLYVRCIRD